MSVKQNYFYSLLNTISGLLFPIVTFPYVARILMADGIGQVNFYLSIINYISMFAGLGIPTYAIREIARVKSNVKEMNQVAVEILLLHTFLTLLGYIVVGVVALTVAQVQVNLPLFLILSMNLFFIELNNLSPSDTPAVFKISIYTIALNSSASQYIFLSNLYLIFP